MRQPGIAIRSRLWLRRRFRRAWNGALLASVFLSFLLLGTTWLIVWQKLESDRRMVGESARLQQESLTAMVSENLSQVLDRGQLLALAAGQVANCSAESSAPLLGALRAADRAFLRITLFDMQLRTTYASSPLNDDPALTEALKQLSTAMRDTASVAARIAPRPAMAEQAWEVPLLYPVFNSDGIPCGILVAVLDLGYFLSLYREVDIGTSGAIELLDGNGLLIARARPGGMEALDAEQPSADYLSPAGGRGSITIPVNSSTPARQASFQRLDDYPLIVAVSREIDELHNGYFTARSRFLGMLLLLSAVVIIATLWIAAAMRRGQRLVTRLARADVEKRRLILQLQEEKHRAYELASHDHLTGLPNRRMFFELGASHLARAKRSRKHYGLMYVDLDRFKTINDSLGHHVGDLLLQTVASRMRSVLRDSDVVARLGGDEFVALLTGLERSDDMAVVANKLTEVIGRPCHNLDGHDIQVSSSIGIAIFPRDGHDIDTLSRHADAAMYQSKRSGKGRYTFYDPVLNPVSDRQFDLELGLPKAIAENELLLHYQPKVSLTDYRITGFEVLLRWQHPEFGLVYPQEFINLAETAGLTIALGDWVAEACCRQLAAWRAEGLAPLPLALNASARQLADTALPGRIATLLGTYGVPASLLEIEITESSLLESIEVTGQILRELEAMGISIALDDFGNGYSSLGYIRSLPIHTIKIDRSFINDIRNSPDDEIIVGSIVTLAHNLKKRVVAEGVELLDQLIHLKTVGCDEVQGYYLSRPAPAGHARQLLIQGTLQLP